MTKRIVEVRTCSDCPYMGQSCGMGQDVVFGQLEIPETCPLEKQGRYIMRETKNWKVEV